MGDRARCVRWGTVVALVQSGVMICPDEYRLLLGWCSPLFVRQKSAIESLPAEGEQSRTAEPVQS